MSMTKTMTSSAKELFFLLVFVRVLLHRPCGCLRIIEHQSNGYRGNCLGLATPLGRRRRRRGVAAPPSDRSRATSFVSSPRRYCWADPLARRVVIDSNGSRDRRTMNANRCGRRAIVMKMTASWSSMSSTTDSAVTATATMITSGASRSSAALGREAVVVRVDESTWRREAERHRDRVRELLLPGLTDPSDEVNSGSRRRRTRKREERRVERSKDGGGGPRNDGGRYNWTALDRRNPVYNFLIEYYGLKGVKGPRRLARWSPDPELLLLVEPDGMKRKETGDRRRQQPQARVHGGSEIGPEMADGILLEGATERDLGATLHLRGAIVKDDGIMYSPSIFFGKDPSRDDDDDENSAGKDARAAATPYLWYRSILQRTGRAEPVFHCYGLHEWAMQYRPGGAPPPPSARYQSHLPLRVEQDVINDAVERKGVHCTHVDALRYFAPAAGPLNHHGSSLQRTDQLRLEQPGCVHANMDLLKIAMRLQPFVSADLLRDVLRVALESRRLDVAASPYDASSYGVGVVPVETSEGRSLYRRRQLQLMKEAQPVREAVLRAYDVFLRSAFSDDVLSRAEHNPADERYAKAEPGGLPWRKNLVHVEAAKTGSDAVPAR